MTSLTVIGAAIAIFVVAALLYYQSHPEGFANPAPGEVPTLEPPTAGRWYNPMAAASDADARWPVPADLNKAPPSHAIQEVPPAQPRPATIPTSGTAPKSAMATRRDLYELDTHINTWLSGADQRERESKGTLTPEQSQRRIMLQARLADVRTQIATGIVTDTAQQVRDEIAQLRRENAGWQQRAPNLDAINSFAATQSPQDFLDATHYAEFKQLFGATLHELASQPQPDPLQRVRLQQLQVFQQSIGDAERTSPQGLPPIRYAAAKLFLRQAQRPDQPLPTLFSMEPNPATQPAATHATTVSDIIGDLKNLQWKLLVTYDPAGQALKRTVTTLLEQVQSRGGAMTPEQLAATRGNVAALNASYVPPAAPTATDAGMPLRPTTGAPYDPANLQRRAATLCKQIREAFPHDAAALGCPATAAKNDYEAETTINTVCSRLWSSVPTVDPAQFNCPKHAV